jgi:hypothetical protein
MKIRLLACLLVIACAFPVSARPAGAVSDRVSSSSRIWVRFLDFFRGHNPFASPLSSEHTIPPPTTTCWSIG